MAKTTGIAWTSRTINPWIGCCKISTGCKNCYAETQENRFGRAVWGPDTERYKTTTSEGKIAEWNRELVAEGKTDTVFCASLSDFFEDNKQVLPWREEWWEIIKAARNIDWLVLTKRADKIAEMVPVDFYNGSYSHVHLGVSIETERYTSRLDCLRALPNWGGLRWTSMEPLLGPLGPVNLTGIDWVIVGGESDISNDYRRMEDAWVEQIMQQCNHYGSVFFFKQTAGRSGTNSDLFQGKLIQNFPKFRGR